MSVATANQGHLFMAMENSLAMIVFDAYGDILWANDNFAEVIKYSVDELKSMHHRELCPDDFRNSPKYEAFWKKLRSHHLIHRKVRRIAKGGKTVYLDIVYTPVTNDEGKVDRVIKIASDITQQETLIKDKYRADK